MSVRDRERQRKLDAMKEEQIRLQQQKSGEARQRVMQALDSNERILQQKRDELEDKMQQQVDRMYEVENVSQFNRFLFCLFCFN